MPYTKIMIHLVWSTKNRYPYLTKENRHRILEHIRNNAKEKAIFIDHINYHVDHVHCLLCLGYDQNLSKVVQLIKGESSHWINKQKLCKSGFEWQDEYYAVSVSSSVLNRVRIYINRQDEHHSKRTFQDEYDEFMRVNGFNNLPQAEARGNG
jgi:REP element-mobilizing transposase RayT